ncbi:hypothetical protein [Mesorhizobium sp. M0053]|uniref:hypothetical protein n=1 Tax=Mesorhizobium sp. M0053 TaxID=2956864 RepID=UPI0033392C06
MVNGLDRANDCHEALSGLTVFGAGIGKSAFGMTAQKLDGSHPSGLPTGKEALGLRYRGLVAITINRAAVCEENPA